MAEISLVVTSKVLNYIGNSRRNQRQIAIRNPSADIADELASLTRSNQRRLILDGDICLVIRDTSAIWSSHNSENIDEFDALFECLALTPDRPATFSCELLR